jgi:hypothetical protein
MGIPVDNITVTPCESFDQMLALGHELRSILFDQPGAIAGVVWDSASDIVARFVSIQRGVSFEEAKAVAVLRGEDFTRSTSFTPLDAWGDVTTQVKELLMVYRDLDCHFGISALPRRDVDDDGEVSYQPAVNPGLITDLTGKPDLVCWTTEEEDGTFTGRFRAGGSKKVKDRLGLLPTLMRDPTMDRVIAYVSGELTVDDDPIQQQMPEAANAAPGPRRPKAKRAPRTAGADTNPNNNTETE